MYVRFISPWQMRRGIYRGLFGPAYDYARDSSVPELLREAMWTELDWFEQNVPIPDGRAFCVKSMKRWRPSGLCWFVDDARDAIARAYALAWLLSECGVPVTKVSTHRPGQILYRDDYQIVAKPEPATPTTWH